MHLYSGASSSLRLPGGQGATSASKTPSALAAAGGLYAITNVLLHASVTVCALYRVFRDAYGPRRLSAAMTVHLAWWLGSLRHCCNPIRLRSCMHRRTRLASSEADDQGVSGYTPSDYITFSEDPAHLCSHSADIVVDAPVDTCMHLWSEWHRLVDFLDLIGQVCIWQCVQWVWAG